MIAGNVYAKKAFVVATFSVSSSQDPSTSVHSLVRASKVPATDHWQETNANAKVKTTVNLKNCMTASLRMRR